MRHERPTFFQLKLLAVLVRIEKILIRIMHCVCKPHPKARSAKLFFETDEGETDMPLTVHINDNPGTAVFTEFSGSSGTGIVVPPVGAVTFSSSNTTVATVDSVTGLLGYVSAGSATISGADGGNGLTASNVLTVSAALAQSATLVLNPGL